MLDYCLHIYLTKPPIAHHHRHRNRLFRDGRYPPFSSDSFRASRVFLRFADDAIRPCASHKASLRSRYRSSACSSPTESRNRSSGVPLDGPSTVFLCSTRDSTPPKDVAGNHTLVMEVVITAAFPPPTHRTLSMPPNIF